MLVHVSDGLNRPEQMLGRGSREHKIGYTAESFPNATVDDGIARLCKMKKSQRW